MSLQRFENESSEGDEKEKKIENRRGSALASLGAIINDTKRGSIFQLDVKRGSIFQNDGKRGSLFQLDARRGSLFPASDYLDNTQQGRGSIFQLFDDPYR